VATSADSGPRSAEEQNTIRREAKARRNAAARARGANGPRSNGSLFRDIRTDPGNRFRRQKLNDFMARGRNLRRQASDAILKAGIPLQDESARRAARRTVELYAATDPQVTQRSENDIRIVVTSFTLAAMAVRDEMSDADRQAVEYGINTAGRALEAYRNNTLRTR
jgi:hypothetical protein